MPHLTFLMKLRGSRPCWPAVPLFASTSGVSLAFELAVSSSLMCSHLTHLDARCPLCPAFSLTRGSFCLMLSSLLVPFRANTFPSVQAGFPHRHRSSPVMEPALLRQRSRREPPICPQGFLACRKTQKTDPTLKFLSLSSMPVCGVKLSGAYQLLWQGVPVTRGLFLCFQHILRNSQEPGWNPRPCMGLNLQVQELGVRAVG